jgi:hypothetical protein
MIPLCIFLSTENGRKWPLKVYTKSTDNRHHNFGSNHPPRVNRVIIHSLHSRDSIIWQEAPHILNELTTWDVTFGSELIPNGSMSHILIPSVAVFQKEEKRSCMCVLILCVTRISRTFGRTENRYNTGIIFTTNHTCRSSLMRTRPEGSPQQTAQWMKQKLLWRNRQTASHSAPSTRPQSQRRSSRKIKISPTCLWRWSEGTLEWSQEFGNWT